MRRLAIIAVVLALAGGVAGLVWWRSRPPAEARELVLYGHIDLRQVLLAFHNSERISAVLVEEGDRVRRGQVVARLDTSRLKPQVAQAEAQVAAQWQVFERLRKGTRPEEIAQARANVEAARAEAANARQRYERVRRVVERRAGTQEELDSARAAVDTAEARLAVNEKALELAIAGPRVEEVAEAEARWKAAQAQIALFRQQLADAQLTAPTAAVVRTRLLEPGEMATPQRPVFALALTDPKWVRAYVSAPDLGKVRHGMSAAIAADGFPGRRFEGWVGFLSPVAEFTPKAVQTEELRTSLVYEVRVFLVDPADELRLGMPVTVYLPLDAPDTGRSEGR